MAPKKRPGPNAKPLTREQAVVAEIFAMDNPPTEIAYRMTANVPIALIRRQFEKYGPAMTIQLAREWFEEGTITDAQILAIARNEATLRGDSISGMTFHDQRCHACSYYLVRARNCKTCGGDGFAPPITEED